MSSPQAQAPLDFRWWLQKEFTDRSRKNPRFSLRSFAKLLEMDASSVSQILAGKRKISPKIVEKVSERLSIPPTTKAQLLSSLPKKKSEASTQAPAFQLSADAFAVVADWYHYAILELTFTENFSSSPKWIAKKLGISATEASVAIERLERLELLERKDGQLVKTEAFLTNYSEGQTGSALKELQRQLLQKALNAIDLVPQEKKDITSITMAVNPANLPEAKLRIKKFRRELCAFLEEGPRTHVYNLGVQLYPISDSTTSAEDNDNE
ncbi:MAG: TIGR02147 family protein [Bdellovibrionota bacterium]